MPELAEVEYFRRQWDAGIGKAIVRVQMHSGKRVFRGADTDHLARLLPGAKLLGSQGHGKRMLFRFTGELWLGIHLGMTGSLRAESGALTAGAHDHLVLQQREQALIFRDPRQFGRVQFHHGTDAPAWWTNLPPGVTSPEFTLAVMKQFLARHGRLSLKAALLLQGGFPGVGNWMADEILWRAKLNPHSHSGSLCDAEARRLWSATRTVCRDAMKHISPAFSDPPKGWLFHERWRNGGLCPIHDRPLQRETLAGRTTAWCSRCQK